MNNAQKIIIEELYLLLQNKSIEDLIDFEVDNIYNKSAVSRIVKRYISENFFYDFDVFKENKIIVKFISVNKGYEVFEAVSLKNTSLLDILFEKWNDSDESLFPSLQKQLGYSYLFIPIIKIKNKGKFNNLLEWEIGDLSHWEPTKQEEDLIGKEWLDIQEIIKRGVEVKSVKYGKSYRNINNLPKQSESSYIHLRPHGKDSFDFDLPFLKYTNGKIEITKQSFWLNKQFVNNLLKNNKWKTISKEE